MKRFIKDLKKYKNYILYATWAELKTEVINSYLGWLWMILEPLAFMFIYMFIASIIFKLATSKIMSNRIATSLPVGSIVTSKYPLADGAILFSTTNSLEV